MLPRRAALPVAALLLLPLAACGSPTRATANPDTAKRHPDPTIVPTVFPSKTPSPTPAASGTTAPTGGATTAPPADPGKIDATAANQFAPAKTTVKVGTEVTWTNKGGFHTVTGGEPNKPDTSLVNGQLSTEGATYSVTFAKAGTYKYFCQPHAAVNMVGEVVVQ